MPDRHAELLAMLQTLKLPAMADTFAALALQAATAGLPHAAFRYELVRGECDQRDQRRAARLLQQSGLPREKTCRTLHLTRFPLAIQQQLERLRRGTFLDEAVNVVAVGRPGAGKRHLTAALGHDLVQQGQRVLWTPTASLVQRLLAAKRDLRLPQFLAQLDRYGCLIRDDIGYVQHNRDEMEVFFTLLAERYERKSVILTTILVCSDWTRIFKDPLTTMAAIDRVVHHSVILDLMAVDSYRAHEAGTTQQTTGPPAPTASTDQSRTRPQAARADRVPQPANLVISTCGTS